jgi:hypothetical protein
MQVLDSAKPDSIKVRFDTASFLGRTQVLVPARKYKVSNSFVSLMKNYGETSKFYDITGKNIQYSSVISRNRSGIIIAERVDANGNKLFLKHFFAAK